MSTSVLSAQTEIIDPPSKDEMQSRIEKVRSKLDHHDLDYYVSFSPDNIFYLTNFANFVHERPFILIIPKSGDIIFLVPKLELPHVRTRSIGNIDFIQYLEFPAPSGETWTDRFKEIIKNDSRVGVESVCPQFVFKIIPGSITEVDMVDEIRMVKSEYEIGRIKYASEMATDAMKKLFRMAKPGLGMLSVHSTINKHMMVKLLLDIPDINFLATRLSVAVQPPRISHDPHNFTNVMDMNMEDGGPHVAIINCVINGYSTEIERTFFLGQIPEEAIEPFETMMMARRKAMELCVPGNNMGEVDRQVNDIFKKAGYGENLLHRTGHSIGVTGHEGPFLAEGYEKEIEPGMFFTIEPGIYIPGVGGFRHSDTVLVTETSNITLTSFPDQLMDMIIPVNKFSLGKVFAKYQIPLMRLYARMKGIKLNN